MKKLLVFLFVCLFPVVISSSILQTELFQSPEGLTFELAFRAYEPGEIVLVSIKDHPLVEKAAIRFQGRSYELKKNSVPFVLIGIDLNLEAAVYPMDISVDRVDGGREEFRKDIPVAARDFPVKKLWVQERFVTPPPEVLERIKRERELLQAVYSIITPEWLGDGEFIMPSPERVAPNFGERRIFNNIPRSTHTGVDIDAPLGAPIKASNSGKVVLTSDLYYSGKTVIVDHGLGVLTLYCHLSKFLVKRGGVVGKGDTIGESGSTGRSTGPHLHWGVKIFDIHVDPLALVSLPLE